MNASIRAMRAGVFSLALLGTIGVASVLAQSVAPAETVRSVQRTLERLPYYGMFDYLVFRVDGGTVYLAGYSFEGRLKTDAEMAAKRATGVLEVGNQIEVLPASQNDDRIRWAAYYRIYTDDFLSRYAPGGVFGVLQELRASGTSQACSQSADTRSTSSSRTGESCCSVLSTARATGSSQRYEPVKSPASSRSRTA